MNTAQRQDRQLSATAGDAQPAGDLPGDVLAQDRQAQRAADPGRLLRVARAETERCAQAGADARSHGASMGDGYGPQVVTRTPVELGEIASMRVAVPGLMTSAFLALSLYLGRPFEHVVVPFDRIMDAVRSGEADAGLLIHEGQLTHPETGLHCVVDLGAWWKAETGLPLPLGVNAIRRDLPPDVETAASRALRESIRYGLEHRESALSHAMSFARDMERGTADRFVGMYVNDWTLDMGEAGRRSIRLFLQRGEEHGVIPAAGAIDFVD